MIIALDDPGRSHRALTHGVAETTKARPRFMLQAGALNESLSDVFGSLIKQRKNRETARKAGWLIGEGLFTPAVHGQARSGR